MKYLKLLLATFLFASASADYSMEELPMYGGKHSPEVAPDPASSKHAAERGWQYYYRGDLSTAMKRFNQAWMLDRNNAQALWGFGVVTGQRALADEAQRAHNLRESLRLLELAWALEPANGKLMGDVAFTCILLGQLAEETAAGSTQAQQRQDATAYKEHAGQLFAKALELEPDYAPLLANYGMWLFHAGDFTRARELTAKAEAQGYPIPPTFLLELKRAEAKAATDKK